MKRLVGGDFLLDMSPIELELSVDGTTKTNITDNEVLGQLTDLKRFIGSPSMVKPIWCKLTNGETDELIVAQGTLAVVDVGEFKICIPLDGYKLGISVEFTQMETEDHEPLDDWYIDTNDAKYILISDKQEVTAIIGDGDIPNAKPIYCHPIAFEYNGTGDYANRYYFFTCLILNNDPTPFTIETFLAYVKSLVVTYDAKIMCSGATYAGTAPSGETVVLSSIQKTPANALGLYGVSESTGAKEFYTILETEIADMTLSDGVNKIN